MKAAYYEGNKKFSVGESKIVPPGDGQVRMKVAYAGICGTDVHIFLGHMDHRLTPPQVVGHEAVGHNRGTGEGCHRFQGRRPRCFATDGRVRQVPLLRERGHINICPTLNFIGITTPGAFQGSWTVPAHLLHKVPDDINMVHAALIEPLAVAAHDVRYGEVKAKDFCVVLGAGPIGMLEAMVCKEKGATVVISEVNPTRLKLARELGFEVVNPAETRPGEVRVRQHRWRGRGCGLRSHAVHRPALR